MSRQTEDDFLSYRMPDLGNELETRRRLNKIDFWGTLIVATCIGVSFICFVVWTGR